MRRYEVLLKSQTDEMTRKVLLRAPSPKHARIAAQAQEARLVSFSAIPSEPVEPIAPSGELPASATMAVAETFARGWDTYEQALDQYQRDLEAYPAKREQAFARLAAMNEMFGVEKTGDRRGKVRTVGGLTDDLLVALGGESVKRAKAHWHSHLQARPYEIVSVKESPLPALARGRLLEELLRLHEDAEEWDDLLAEMRERGIHTAAVTAGMYLTPVKNQYDGTAVIDWDTDTMKYGLSTSSHTIDSDAHDFWNDVTANEATGTNWAAGGATLGSKTATTDAATDQARLDAADISVATVTVTARNGHFYKSTGTASTSPLLGWNNYGADVTSSGGTFAVTFDTTGLALVDVT